MTDQVAPESWYIPRALSNEALRLLTTLPMDEIERRLRTSPPRPIPVSERLPGPEDCGISAGGYFRCSCWCWNPPSSLGGIGWWSIEPLEWCEGATHWLPAHALPLPEVE